MNRRLVRLRWWALGAAVAPGLVACSTLGPAAIRGGRAAYNQAITSTDNQQLLGLIVKTRYAENVQLLAVSSVTANMSISARVGADFGVGPDANFAGNLVPLTSGVVVEENPTISYVPIEGEQYFRELLSPVPLDLALLLINASDEPGDAFSALVANINEIPNHAFVDPSSAPDPRFAEVVDLLRRLDAANALSWRVAGATPEAHTYAIVLNWPARLDAEVRDLLSLLGTPPTAERRAVLPLGFGDGSQGGDVVWIGTRSIGELVKIASAAMDVAPEHRSRGLVTEPIRELGHTGRLITVRGSKTRPRDAYVDFQQHGWWYSIAHDDTASKRYFKLLSTLISIRITETLGSANGTPVLTIPTAN
ncbi:MAG: hypothetical protein AAGA57_06940 [Planctomycetota bacterium]